MVGDSCDNLLANYRIFFEGMPDPVFYKYFYPTGDNTGVLWDLYHYVRGLKKDKDSDAECYYKYSEMPAGPNGGNLSYYEKDLRQLLRAVWKDTGGKAVKGAVATIPSSDVQSDRDGTRRAEQLRRRLCRPDANHPAWEEPRSLPFGGRKAQCGREQIDPFDI